MKYLFENLDDTRYDMDDENAKNEDGMMKK